LINLKVEIATDKSLDTASIPGNNVALSPDGSRLALALRGEDGKTNLYTRLLNQSEVTPLSGTENATSPFFSPAGDWIAFFAEGKLKKVGVDGGAPITLSEIASGRGGSWGDDGNIVTDLNGGSGLARIPSSGGAPVPASKLNPGEATHRWPQVLPGGRAVLFTASSGRGTYDDANIDVISFQTGERKTVVRGGFSPRYLPSANGAGHLVYIHQTTLFALPFDPSSLSTSGTPTPIMENVSSNTFGGGVFAFANNGTLVYLAGKAATAGWPISWVDSTGNSAPPLHAPAGQCFGPRFSPDGKRLAFSMSSGKGSDIWVKGLDRDTPSRLSFLPDLVSNPVWTPDGKSIVFKSSHPPAPGLYAIRSDGSGEAKRLTDGKAQEFPSSFSPDGKRLAINQYGNGGSFDIFTVPVEADPGSGGPGLRFGKAELFLGTPFGELYPAFSQDGRWLAYQSSESGTPEIYVRPFPGPGGRWQVSSGGGRSPVWSRDARELLFLDRDGRVMAAPYTAKGDSFAAGKPRVWADVRLQTTGYGQSYDITPDGKRLAALVAENSQGEKLPTHLTFLLNFGDELRRRVAVAK